MTKKSANKDTKASRFVIGSDRFAKISEVDGIRLTTAMKQRALKARAQNLTSEEFRRTIIRSHRKG